jgi:hypothetical protein
MTDMKKVVVQISASVAPFPYMTLYVETTPHRIQAQWMVSLSNHVLSFVNAFCFLECYIF